MTSPEIGDATRRVPSRWVAMEGPVDGQKQRFELSTDEISSRNLFLTCENRRQILSGTDRDAPGSHGGRAALAG